MKIAHISLASNFIDNFAYQINLLAKYHVLQGHNTTVIASQLSIDNNGNRLLKTEKRHYIDPDGYDVYRLEYSKLYGKVSKILRIYNGLQNLLEIIQPDIIFIHGCQFLEISTVVRFAKRKPSVKIFVDNHADFINSARSWLSENILHRIIWRYCANLILPYTEKFYGVLPIRCSFLTEVYGIPPHKIEYLPLGVDDYRVNEYFSQGVRGKIRRELGINDDNILFICGGKLDRRKNIHLLLNVFNVIPNSRVKLLLFGIPSEEMKQVIEHKLNSRNIIYKGWLSPRQIIEYFLASDIAIFPGTHSVLWEESVGCGLPIIAKYWEGMDHIDLGGNSILLYENNENEIIRVIERVINDKDLFLEMKLQAKTKGMKLFSYSEIAKKAIDY